MTPSPYAPIHSHYMRLGFALLCASIGLLIASPARAQVGDGVSQLIVARAATWDSSSATLQCFQRASARDAWQPAFAKPWAVLLGRAGLAWGRGPFSLSREMLAGHPIKVEKDWRAPAGLFRLGQLFGYADAPPQGSRWPYLQVGAYDAWIDDVNSPLYNRHVRVDPNNIPPWFEKARMRLGDSAYRWMLEIQHNSAPAEPGLGSAIFFHVRRGPTKPSAGCTTMALENLEAMIKWLNPRSSPHYVLLPEPEYQALRAPWRLP